MRVNSALTVGIFAASSKPLATSLAWAALISVASLTVTLLSWTDTESLPSPLSTATRPVWASRLAASQAAANSGDLTNVRILSVTNFLMLSASGVDSAARLSVIRVGRPCSASASAACLVSVWICSRLKISLLMRWTIASCTIGSEASGATVATYRSVFETSSCAQIAITDTGASNAATRISRPATNGRQRPRRPGVPEGRPDSAAAPGSAPCRSRHPGSRRRRTGGRAQCWSRGSLDDDRSPTPTLPTPAPYRITQYGRASRPAPIHSLGGATRRKGWRRRVHQRADGGVYTSGG